MRKGFTGKNEKNEIRKKVGGKRGTLKSHERGTARGKRRRERRYRKVISEGKRGRGGGDRGTGKC